MNEAHDKLKREAAVFVFSKSYPFLDLLTQEVCGEIARWHLRQVAESDNELRRLRGSLGLCQEQNACLLAKLQQAQSENESRKCISEDHQRAIQHYKNAVANHAETILSLRDRLDAEKVTVADLRGALFHERQEAEDTRKTLETTLGFSGGGYSTKFLLRHVSDFLQRLREVSAALQSGGISPVGSVLEMAQEAARRLNLFQARLFDGRDEEILRLSARIVELEESLSVSKTIGRADGCNIQQLRAEIRRKQDKVESLHKRIGNASAKLEEAGFSGLCLEETLAAVLRSRHDQHDLLVETARQRDETRSKLENLRRGLVTTRNALSGRCE